MALSGGVGGAKLVAGLADVLGPDQLSVVTNTADDFTHLGLHISPDLDTVIYTLAGVADPDKGWGLADESWHFMQALARLDGETWFNLGDRDLATHILRTQMLAGGMPLGAVTAALSEKFGVGPTILPMSDDPVRTMVTTDMGELSFQQYFVREQCRPKVRRIRFEGCEAARPVPEILALLADPDLAAIVICPSNPLLSIDPILSVAGMRGALKAAAAPVIAVSPLIGGKAVKGPTAKMMQELDIPVTAAAVAAHYGDLLDGFVLDTVDAASEGEIAATGTAVSTTNTLMTSREAKQDLARHILERINPGF